MTRVKICGITRLEDAELAVELGASAIGLVLEPSSKRFVSAIPLWLAMIPVYVSRVAVLGEAPEKVVDDRFDMVQAFGVENAQFRGRKIASIRCGADASPEALLKAAEGGEAILLDADIEGQMGGTGKTANWDIAAEVARMADKPVILAGGLTPDNVVSAIEIVRPYAVDVASGVESSPGIKDRAKMKAFFEAVRSVI